MTTHILERIMTGAAITAIALTTVLAGPARPAVADDYPTWDDVAAVRNDEAATLQRINQIESLLASLEAEAARTQAESDAKGTLWVEANGKYQEASNKMQTLLEQAEKAGAVAEESATRAGQIAATMGRLDGGGLTANLFVNPEGADDLLYGLGMWAKIGEQANLLMERAIVDRNTAQALTDQAEVAKQELEELKLAAETAFAEAQVAAAAAQAVLQEQLANQATLRQQLIVLKERRASTEADYLAGVQARIGSGVSLDAGEISLAGWARPVSGYITSSFGWRTDPWYSFHSGTDISASCDQNIYAGSSGTVIYAAGGWNGGYGNYIILDHGNGITTAYAHIIDGGILVSAGQEIVVGQNIARAGTTGASTGCHLHYEVLLNGVATNSVPFMAERGIRIG